MSCGFGKANACWAYFNPHTRNNLRTFFKIIFLFKLNIIQCIHRIMFDCQGKCDKSEEAGGAVVAGSN